MIKRFYGEGDFSTPPDGINEEVQEGVTFGFRNKLEENGLTRGSFSQIREKIDQGMALTTVEKEALNSAVHIHAESRLDAQVNDIIRELRYWDPERMQDHDKRRLIRLCDILLNELIV